NARVSLTVIGLVSETIDAVVVGGGRVAEAAVAVEGQSAVSGLADQHGAQSVPVDVTVVGEHASSSHDQSRVFGSGVAVIDRDRSVLDAPARDSADLNARVSLTVIGLVSETIDAVVVGGGRVAEAAVAVEGQSAVSRLADQHRAQSVPVDVTVVGDRKSVG